MNPAINPFDAAVIVFLLLAIVMGYNSGLLRSLATIFGYVAAMPIAVGLTPKLMPLLTEKFNLATLQPWVVVGIIALVGGAAISALLRMAIGEMTGAQIGLVDRMAGAMLGAVRIVLLAVLMVMIFERIIPQSRQPAWLSESRLRPVLSEAGQKGLRSLPPDVAAYIDRLKRERGI